MRKGTVAEACGMVVQAYESRPTIHKNRVKRRASSVMSNPDLFDKFKQEFEQQ